MKQVVPGMRERGKGSILNLTTFVAELPPGPPFALVVELGNETAEDFVAEDAMGNDPLLRVHEREQFPRHHGGRHVRKNHVA